MILLKSLIAAAVALSPHQTPAKWVCQASIGGPTAMSRLSVSFVLNANRSVRSRRVAWSPKQVHWASAVAGLTQNSLTLWIVYRDATRPDPLGPPASVGIAVDSGPGPAVSRPLMVRLRLDNGRTWVKSLQLQGGDVQGQLVSTSSVAEIASNGEDGIRTNLGLLDEIVAAHVAEVTLRDATGALYAKASYQIAPNNRECMSRTAWAAADQASRHLARPACSPANVTEFGGPLPLEARC